MHSEWGVYRLSVQKHYSLYRLKTATERQINPLQDSLIETNTIKMLDQNDGAENAQMKPYRLEENVIENFNDLIEALANDYDKLNKFLE